LTSGANYTIARPEEQEMTTKPKAKRGRAQQVARAGEFFVAAELSRRGAHAAVYVGNMPRTDLVASNVDQTRTVNVQVKTRRAGSWQASTKHGHPSKRKPNETHFWVLVDILDNKEVPEYYIMPEWWIRNNIDEAHKAYLAKHGGKRPRGSESTHHSISPKRIEQWKDRWEILGLDLEEVRK